MLVPESPKAAGEAAQGAAKVGSGEDVRKHLGIRQQHFLQDLVGDRVVRRAVFPLLRCFDPAAFLQLGDDCGCVLCCGLACAQCGFGNCLNFQ